MTISTGAGGGLGRAHALDLAEPSTVALQRRTTIKASKATLYNVAGHKEQLAQAITRRFFIEAASETPATHPRIRHHALTCDQVRLRRERSEVP